MRRIVRLGLALCALALNVSTAAAGQAAAVPLSLGVLPSESEVVVGAAVSVTVSLKNYKGDAVPATEPLTVALHSELAGDQPLAFKLGQSSAETTVKFARTGVDTLVASARGVAKGSAVVVVAAGESTVGFVGFVAPDRPAPKRLRAGATLGLQLDVLPQHVHPERAAWKALVLVTTVDEGKDPVAVDADTAVHLATDLGIVSPADTKIPAGTVRASGPIQVTSDRPGRGTLWAWTDNGRLTMATVEYHDAVPSQLLVKGLPGEVVNDGRSAAHVTVFLQDETSAAATTDQDVSVRLDSSLGTAAPSALSIPKGQFFAEALLTSATSGLADITATAVRLKSGSAQVRFVFPFLLITMAAVGGLVGSLVRSRQLPAGAWWWHLAGSVAIGVVMGLLFYALALFGIIASIPKLSLPLERLPTTNEIAAIVLGFFGGFYGRSWLPDPTNP